MAREQSFPATPINTAAGRVIASPFQFVSSGEDNIRVVSANSLAGVRVKIQGRRLSAAGDVEAFAWDHVPNSDRSVKTDDFALGVGAVLNLVAFASAGAPRIGQTFVIVQLIRGAGVAGVVLGTLLQGYVTRTQVMAWPGSPLQSSTEGQGLVRYINGATPAAGAEISESVPTGARWQLLAFMCSLAASAVAGTRTPMLATFGGGLTRSFVLSALGVAAGGTISPNWLAGLGTAAPIVAPYVSNSLPVDLVILAGGAIFTTTVGLQAGDTYTFIGYTVREWLEVD